MKTKWREIIAVVIALLAIFLVINSFAVWDVTKPADSDAIYTWPAWIRANWDALDDSHGLDIVGQGADPTGAADSRTAIFNANALGQTLLFPAGTYKISSDLTITMSCIFLEGAILTPDAGVTVTIEGSPTAGNYQIVGGDGTVKFTIGSINTVWYTNGGAGTSASHWTGPDGQGGIGEAIAANLAGVGITANANREFIIPAGHFTVTETILINRSRMVVKGAGIGATNIYFASVNANDILFELSNAAAPASGIFFGKLSGVHIWDSTAGSLDVIAIQPTNISLWTFEDIEITGPATANWDGIGIKSRGRELCTYNRIRISADQPIQISQNPERASVSLIDIDATVFRDMYLSVTAAGKSVILIDDAVNLSHVSFEGRQNWIGDGGLLWTDSTGNRQHQQLTIRNVKHESGTDNTIYTIKIDLSGGTASLECLVLENIRCDLTSRGYYFRNVNRVTISNSQYGGTAAEALNVDSSVQGLTLLNNFWANGSSITMTGQEVRWASGQITGPLPAIAFYGTTALSVGLKDNWSDLPLGSENVFISNDGVATLCSSTFIGLMVVADNLSQIALYHIKGDGGNAVAEIADPDNDYTVTKDNAGTTNIYYDSGFKIQNKTGASRTYTFTKLGRQ